MYNYTWLKSNFKDIDIKYNNDLNILKIKCTNIQNQLLKYKKIIKILIFWIQSKYIPKNVIILEINDSDFISKNLLLLLNIIKLTKTLHYFNLIIKENNVPFEQIKEKIDYIQNNYVGININKKLIYNK